MTRQNDLKKLIAENERRLQKRNEQKATLGISADPSLDIEIEDIEVKLERLQSELANVENSNKPNPPTTSLSSNNPLSWGNLLAGIIVTVIGGFILAFFIQEGRFTPTPMPLAPTGIIQAIDPPIPVTTLPDMPTITPTPTPNPLPQTPIPTVANLSLPSGYPCEAEIISSTGSTSINTVRANASSAASIVNKPLDVETIVLIYNKKFTGNEIWYEIGIDARNRIGWLPPENLLLFGSCPN